MEKTRILLVDDHPIVRKGLIHMLNLQEDMEVVGEAGDGTEALEKALALRPQVLIMDLSMPRMSGFDAVLVMREKMPQVAIVICSMYEKEEYAHKLLAAGVLGYVLKGSSFTDLVQAVRAASRGEHFLSSKINAGVIGAFLRSRKAQAADPYELLSAREQQVFRLLVEGHATGRIAEMLYISPKTVEKHRVNIMNKLDVHDLIGMVKYAVRIGVIDPESWKN